MKENLKSVNNEEKRPVPQQPSLLKNLLYSAFTFCVILIAALLLRYTTSISMTYSLGLLLLNQYLDAVHTAVPLPTASDMAILQGRRAETIIHSNGLSTSKIDNWTASLQPSGLWPDIDMTSGCDARRASWPAIKHLDRTRALAVAFAKDTSNTTLYEKANSALTYWLDHDFTELDCLDEGGNADYNCPCGTPGLWNRNWFSQVIAVPTRIGDTCLLLKDRLKDEQKVACTVVQSRAFESISQGLHAVKNITGANLLDISSIGVTLGLFENNAATVQRALNYFYSGVVINPEVAGDGIQADGSFMQHQGLLYNGNYGKDYIFDLLSVFLETKDTSLKPGKESQDAFETLIDGTEWMIVADTKLNALLWQYSVIGRIVAVKYSDGQASGGVDINIDDIAKSTEGWDAKPMFDELVNRLDAPHTKNANQGNLVGTRYFYNADYMVHRAPNFVTTMKMYSTRTINSECVNEQNPFGYHLSDGAIYTYVTGDEYVDTFGAWDWELVPGITVDYGGTPLQCKSVRKKGKKSFVGGVTDGNTGAAVFDYLNPSNGNLSFKKTAFFFPSGYAIQVASVTSKNTHAPLITVLDQKRRNGDIYVSGEKKDTNSSYMITDGTNSIWHDSIGYYFPTPEVLHVGSETRNANWSSIGISDGNEEMQLFTPYIEHTKSSTAGLLTEYIVQPNITAEAFHESVEIGRLPITLDFNALSPQVNAAYSAADRTIAVAFWTAGTYTVPWMPITFATDEPCVLVFKQTSRISYRLTVADPSQKLTNINLNVTVGGNITAAAVKLPTGNTAGRGVVQTISLSNEVEQQHSTK